MPPSKPLAGAVPPGGSRPRSLRERLRRLPLPPTPPLRCTAPVSSPSSATPTCPAAPPANDDRVTEVILQGRNMMPRFGSVPLGAATPGPARLPPHPMTEPIESTKPEPAPKAPGLLPGIAIIALWMLLLCGIGLFGVITHNYPPVVTVFCALFAASAQGLLKLRRWGWALALAAAFPVHQLWRLGPPPLSPEPRHHPRHGQPGLLPLPGPPGGHREDALRPPAREAPPSVGVDRPSGKRLVPPRTPGDEPLVRRAQSTRHEVTASRAGGLGTSLE